MITLTSTLTREAGCIAANLQVSLINPMTHPIVLPPHIEIKLIDEAPRFRDGGAARERWLIQRAAQLGADQELEACCEWIRDYLHQSNTANALRENRRPKPPSLKEQALKMLAPINSPVMPGTPEYRLYEPQVDIIRRALESIPDPQD